MTILTQEVGDIVTPGNPDNNNDNDNNNNNGDDKFRAFSAHK